MELHNKLLEQIACNKRPKTEEHMLIVMDKSTHEEHLYQPLKTNEKQFKIAVTFLTSYNGIFNITNSNDNFYFKKTVTDADDFIQNAIPLGAYEIEILNNEIKRSIIDEEDFNESDYPFQVKPNFSTLGSNLEISPEGPIFSFVLFCLDMMRLNFRNRKNIIYHLILLIFYHLIMFLSNMILLKE